MHRSSTLELWLLKCAFEMMFTDLPAHITSGQYVTLKQANIFHVYLPDPCTETPQIHMARSHVAHTMQSLEEQ